MKNLNTTQLTLPLEEEENTNNSEYCELVKQNWAITFSRQYMTSIYSKRVMGLVAAQIKEDQKVQKYYQITADKIIQITGLDKKEVYKNIKSVIYELANIVYYIEDKKTHSYTPRHLLDTTRNTNPAGYHNGILTIAFNPKLDGIINEFSHYSEYELNSYIRYKSWYSMRLYELLSALRDKRIIEFNIEKYRGWMGCGIKLNAKGQKEINKTTGKPKYIKYRNHSDAIKGTTREPIKEFKGSNLEFKVKPIYEEATGVGRPKIAKVRFTLISKNKSSKEKFNEWKQDFPGNERIYTRLKNFSVEDAVIFKFAPIIGRKRLFKLLYDWDLRQISPDRIANTENYCSKILKSEAEKILKK